jgi:hypothetical protein
MGRVEKLKPDFGPITPPCGWIQTPGRVRPTPPSTANNDPTNSVHTIPTIRVLWLIDTINLEACLDDNLCQRVKKIPRTIGSLIFCSLEQIVGGLWLCRLAK